MNVEEYGGSYRRLFMEKTFQDKIENFVPNQSDYEEVDALRELFILKIWDQRRQITDSLDLRRLSE